MWPCSCHPAKHTLRFLILPAVTSLTTIAMTVMQYEETPATHEWLENKTRAFIWERLAEENLTGINMTFNTAELFWRQPPASDLLISSCVNNPYPEEWSSWLARWTLWHLTVFFVVECKAELYPRCLKWLPMAWGLSLLLVIYSGFSQLEGDRGRYSGKYGEVQSVIHSVFAVVAFIICWLEVVMFWCPSRVLHVAYGCLVFFFLCVGGSLPWIGEIAEWAIVVLHMGLIWYKYPFIQKQMQNGAWKPWVGCCHCCCSGLEVTQDGNNFCPPAGGDCFGSSALQKATGGDAQMVGQPVAQL